MNGYTTGRSNHVDYMNKGSDALHLVLWLGRYLGNMRHLKVNQRDSLTYQNCFFLAVEKANQIA